MGNCSIKGTTGECHHSIRILCDTGSILQFKGPKTVAQVLQHYPGYGIFLQGHASSPLKLHECLSYGLFYYLLPLKEEDQKGSYCSNGVLRRPEKEWKGGNREQEQPNKSPCTSTAPAACDYVENLSHGSALEVLPSAENGVWKVKLVIDTRQLEEILSEQVNTEALIEKMRMAATACSATSPTRTTWKGGWKPTIFSTFLAPVYRPKIAATATAAHTNLGTG